MMPRNGGMAGHFDGGYIICLTDFTNQRLVRLRLSPPNQNLFAMYSRSTVIANLTVSEFQEVVRNSVTEVMQHPSDRYVYGSSGLAALLGISIRQAQRVIASGEIDDAIFRNGKTLVIEAAKAVRLWGRKNVSLVETR